MVDLSQFLSSDGTRIRFGRLTEVSVGTFIGAIFAGIASVILSLADVPIALLGGLSSFLGSLIEALLGLYTALIDGGFAGASEFVLDAGPLGFVVPVGLVLVTLYSLAWVVSNA